MPDVDLDRLLAPLRDQELAEPEPLAGLERRAARVRRRRWASRLGGAVAAVVIATVAVGLLPDSADQIVRTAPPDNSQPRPGPILPGGERLHGYRVIHRDVIDGEQWQLLTGSDQAGRPCVELRARLGARQLCGDDFYPNRPFEEGSQSVAGTEVRFGPAAASVARIHLVLDDGTAIDATMIKPASGFPIRAWFAVIPKGSRVRIVAPLDANGLPAGSG